MMKIFKLRRVRWVGGVLAGFAALVTTLVVSGSAAMAMQVPGSEGGGAVIPPVHPAQLAPVVPVAVGMPGWQIALIAVGAAIVAAVLAVLADRARSARGRLGAVPRQASRVS
jgi:hypothetical protein